MSTPLWAPFVLPEVAASLCAHPGPARGRCWRMTAVALFADVSGFTAMAEALSALGPTGAELLTDALNALFTPLVAAIEQRGGRVAKFAGDAMTVLFPYEGDPTGAARAAVSAAAAIQAHLAAHRDVLTPAGSFPLAVKEGLGLGPVLVLVGGQPERIEVLVAGPALEVSAEAEHHATRGQIVLHREVYALLPHLPAEPRQDFFVLDEGAPAEQGALPALPPPQGDHPDGMAFLHPVIAARVRAGQERFVGEHRRVVVLFARLFDLDLGWPDVAERAGALLEQIVSIVLRLGGTLDKVDCGDKGTKVIVLFGAPLAREDDEDRALRCALQLVEQLGASVGLHAGMAFCGLVGSPSRREYTAIGDAVNLAARLMQAAQGTLLASSEVFGPVAERYRATALPPLQVKGRREPVRPFQIEGLRRLRFSRTRAVLPLVGRLPELERLEEALQEARQGRGAVLEISGEPGMGKSRLADAAVDRALALGFSVHGGTADDRSQDVPWHLWREVWAGVVELEEGRDDAWARDKLEAVLASVGQRERLPLVAAVLGLQGEGGEEQLPSEAARRRALETALAAVLDEAARQSPRLLVLEDAHWMDPASRSMTVSIARRVGAAAVVMLILARQRQEMLPALPHVSRVQLGAMGASEIARLVALHLGRPEAELGPLAETLAEQAQGNPLHVGQIVQFARERGLPLDELGGHLPSSLRALIASRLDTLREEDRVLLKAASIVGRRFLPEAVGSYFPEAQDSGEGFERMADRAVLERAPAGGELVFSHRLTHQVTYEGIARSTRQELHQRYALHLQTLPPAEPHELAQHAELSGDAALQRFWFARAAETDEAAWADEAASRWWSRLLPVVEEEHRDRVLVRLGRCHFRAGQWEAAEAAWKEALQIALSQGDVPTEVGVRMQLGELAAARGHTGPALQEFERARQLAASLRDGRAELAAISSVAQTLFLAGDTARAEALAAQAEPHALRLGALSVLASLLMVRGTCATSRDPRNVSSLEQALSLAMQLRELPLAARAAGNLGGAWQRAGALDRARELHGLNHALAQQCGDVRSASIALGNLGVVLHVAGDTRGALACVAAHARLFLDLDDRRSLGFALGNLASGLLVLGRLALARRALDAALGLLRACGLHGLVAAYRLVDARLHEREGDLVDARQAAQEAVSSGEPLAAGRSSRLLLQRLTVLTGGQLAAAEPEDSAFARWCAHPLEPGYREEAWAEVQAAWRAAPRERRDLELGWRLLDLGELPPEEERWPLPPGVDPDPDLEALLTQLERVGGWAQ
jgi:class 3 adenylate cyclase/tetratricopeptide (TPR) repeat protein